MRQVQQENEILKVCQMAFSIENIIVNTVLLKTVIKNTKSDQ